MILPSIKIAYTSSRPFFDGPVTERFPVNDPANIAYALGGDYFSFMTLRRLSPRQLRDRLAPFDLVFVPVDHRELSTVKKICAACDGRLVTYSEGNIADYQMHGPAGQLSFLQIINQAVVNFLYWEKYVPFYRSLTSQPVYYLPYPFFPEDAAQFKIPFAERKNRVTLPTGFTGKTRNGLVSLTVARELLQNGDIDRIDCWLSARTYTEDAGAIQQFLLGIPFDQFGRRLDWRRLMKRTRIDYRLLLGVKKRLRKDQDAPPPPRIVHEDLALYRRRTWFHYLPRMAENRLVIDMNNRQTVGRNALDCAAVGIPCISTTRSDIQPKLFPATSLADSWDIAGAVALCQRLLQDSVFYTTVVDVAADALEQFGAEAFRRRFAAILDEQPSLLQNHKRKG
jgi:hypothetical protein